MDKTKILIVLPLMDGSGVVTVMSLLARSLDRARYEPILVLFNKTGRFVDRVPGDIEIIDLEKRGRWSFFALIFKLRRIVKERKPHIVLSSLYYPNIVSILATLFSRVRCKTILCEHSHYRRLLRHKPFRRLAKLLMFFTYRRADRIICVSDGVRVPLLEDFKIEPDRAQVIYNPIDIEETLSLADEAVAHRFFDGEDGRCVIVTVGRLTRQKNHELLIDAVARCRRQVPARLLIVGEGECEHRLRRRVDRLGLGDHVDFVGFQPNPFKWMKRADIFVLSSSWEGFGVVLVEAMVCGTPCVSTDCDSGPNEIVVHDRSGKLVPEGDVDALSRAIVEVAVDGDLRGGLAREGSKAARRFDHSLIVERYDEVFQEVLERQR